VKIQALDFSHDDEYLISTGGQDDCKLVIWRVKTGIAICGSPVPYDYATTAIFFNNNANRLVTCGDYKLTVWDLDVPNRKLHPHDCDSGRNRRIHLAVVQSAK
jgi:WD40 repeat protein